MVPLLERLMRRMRVAPYTPLGLPSRCREWTGSVDRFGHGRVKVDGKNVHVRRALFSARGVTLSPDKHVIALCQNSRCVNDEHLVVGTDKEARALGRHGRVGIGELVVAKQMIKNREATAKDFAECLEISEALLTSVIARVRWDDPGLRKAS
jgi:hypothetical protein